MLRPNNLAQQEVAMLLDDTAQVNLPTDYVLHCMTVTHVNGLEGWYV